MSAHDSMNHPTNNGDNRYGGMIKQSYIKILRNHLFALFTYLDSAVPSFFPMHNVITVWRMIQFIGPSLCAAYNRLWDPNQSVGRAVSIISIFFHIVPVKNRRDASVAVEFIYFGINVLFFIITIGSAYYYKKQAKLPKALAYIISIYIHTIGYLIHPINLNLVGEDIGRIIDGTGLKLDVVTEVLSIVLSMVQFI